jgi:uncharacterized protein with beta-barrel porin domain
MQSNILNASAPGDFHLVNSTLFDRINVGGTFYSVNSNIVLARGSIGNSLLLENSRYNQSAGSIMNIGGLLRATESNINLNSGSYLNLGGSIHSTNSIFNQSSGSVMNVGGSFVAANSNFENSSSASTNIRGDLISTNSSFTIGSIARVSGDYVQQSGSSLTIKPGLVQDGPLIFAMGGKAQLGGALEVVAKSAPKRHDSITILTAAGGVVGEFDSFNSPYPRQPGQLLYYDLNYQPNAVYFEAVQNDFQNALSIFNLTSNQSAAASALDSALLDPRQDSVLSYLNGFSITAIPALLDQIAPEELGALYSVGFARMSNTVGSLENRFADIRSLREGSFTAVQESNGASSSAKSSKQAQVLTPPARNRYGSFTTANGSFSSNADTGNASGYDSESGLLLSGFDVRISDPLTLGLLVGYARTKSDLNDGGEIEVNGGSLALYGQYVREGWFVESMIGGSYNSYDTERLALNGTASGDTQGGGLDAYVSLGKDLKRGGLTVTPFASLLYTRVGIDGYDEGGSLQPLYIESQAADSLSSRIGLRAAQAFLRGDAVITPYASAQWQHEYLDDACAVDYRFSNGSGSTSTAYGPEIGRNSLLLSGGLQVAWERFACYLSYQADLGRENYKNQSVLTGLRVSW